VASFIAALRELVGRGRRLVDRVASHAVEQPDDPDTAALVRRARDAHAAGRRDEEATLLHEAGRTELARGRAPAALAYFRAALRLDRDFLPALVAVGDAYEAAHDHREAVRAWERAVESHPALPLLARLEHAYREEGRPSRMIALYQNAIGRSSDDLALAVALGRVYLELEMLDEAAAAFDEYRRALRLGHAFEWPHACSACGANVAGWRERCERCRRWNTIHPIRG
jgi:tetratricopeptide (TPR) repeat protein